MARRKIDLPAQLDQAFNVPEDASVEELNALITEAREKGLALLDDPKAGTGSERAQKANWLSAAVAAMESRQDELVANSEAEKAELEAARAALSPKAADADPDDPDAPKEDDPDDQKPKADGDVVDSGTVTVTDASATGAPAAQPALVASSSSRRSAVAAAASAGKAPTLPERRSPSGRRAYLTAASGVSGYEGGAEITFDDLGKIADKRFASLPKRKGNPAQVLDLGAIRIESDERLVASQSVGDDVVDVADAVKWALSMERLGVEIGDNTIDSLVAAGGWCAPSETLYDLLNLSTRDGLLDTPSITVNRGGVRFSLGPDFTAVYNAGANFTKTEAQAIAGAVKPVVNIPCPSFTDNRMLVDGMYFTGDILSAKGYPEAYADFLDKASIAFAHYVNAVSIADEVTLSTLVDFTAVHGANISAVSTVLGALELEITDVRYKNRLSMTETVEVVLPFWAKGVLRSDMSKRLGYEGGVGVTDADIDNFFAIRGARVQWVYDWQDAFTGISGGFGGATSPLAWPTSLNYLVYPAGTFVRALSDVIELQAVYDSTLLATNQFVALFMEQGRLTLKRAWDSRNVKVPIVVSGATALGVDYTLVANQPTV